MLFTKIGSQTLPGDQVSNLAKFMTGIFRLRKMPKICATHEAEDGRLKAGANLKELIICSIILESNHTKSWKKSTHSFDEAAVDTHF
jgi:hypothetical protein